MPNPLPTKLYWPRKEWQIAVNELLEMELTKIRGLCCADLPEENVMISGIPVIPTDTV